MSGKPYSIGRRDGKKIFVSCQVDPDELIRIETLAKLQGITKSEFIRRAVTGSVKTILREKGL